jgi:NADH-quinone oxidoreductase subunit B
MGDQIIPATEIRGPQDKSGAPGTLFIKLEDAVRWARTKSMWPLLLGLACCAIEMMATFAAHFDLARFGMEVYRGSPRQADLMIVSGRVSRKMAPVLRRLYDQMAEPKWVIAMGDCASSGGVYNNYAILQGVDEILPVDVYISGCPPRPEALIDGILMLHKKVQTQEPRGQIRIEDFGLRG